uniref:AlNc14C18G1866 protein n=1 Tax=Albugo laibachii Nc14 TaxID=890382 RepID=F0W4P5_9STRA|nr:AlNc14C18G1866 [Albugo laibachii Nc14]|eukprot:CCA16079.1 AlNc14C18G1866 [Albugo laibachii Nc14]
MHWNRQSTIHKEVVRMKREAMASLKSSLLAPLACDSAQMVTTIASLAGLDYDTNARCSLLHGKEYPWHDQKYAARLPITRYKSAPPIFVRLTCIPAKRFPA